LKKTVRENGKEKEVTQEELDKLKSNPEKKVTEEKGKTVVKERTYG